MTRTRTTLDRRPRRVRARWKAVRIAAVAIAAAIVVELIGLAGWRLYDHWRLGSVELINDGPPLRVEVLDASGEAPVGEPFEVVSRWMLALPDGEYRLRASGAGRLGRTYRFAVNRGETVEHNLSLDEGRLLGGEPWPRRGAMERPREEPRPFAPITRAVALTPGKSDFIEVDGRTVIRRDAQTGRPVWDLSRGAGPDGPPRDTGPWIRAILAASRDVALVDPPPDLDGDHVGDLVWAFRQHPSLLALSGKDGSILWDYSGTLDGPGGPRPDGPDQQPGPGSSQSSAPGARWGGVVGSPLMVDADRDGTLDVIATLAFAESREDSARRAAAEDRGAPRPKPGVLYRRVIVAISGRSGRWLWSAPADGSFHSHMLYPMGALPQGSRTPLIAILDDTAWVELDPSTGRRKGPPIDLGFEPVRPVQRADLDGDGLADVLALGPGPAAKQQSLLAISAGGGTLWSVTVTAPFKPPEEPVGPSDWPWLLDLDGDGRCEVAVPDSGPMPPGVGYRGVRLLDGRSGRTLWTRPMRPENQAADGIVHLADAPDLDGDGTRDLVVLSVFKGRQPPPARPWDAFRQGHLYVDALSGKDGHPLWSWTRELPDDRSAQIWPLVWWGRGPDGWPLLAVPVGGMNNPDSYSPRVGPDFRLPAGVHVLEVSTGREFQTASGLYRPEAADLDGDGLLDLWGEADGQLRAFRGQAPEAWRAIGVFEPAGADLDGDGVGDAVLGLLQTPGDIPPRRRGSRTVVARSGRDGRAIWRTALERPEGWFEPDHPDLYSTTTLALPHGDLDGDGTPDVLAQNWLWKNVPPTMKGPATLPLQALSGRTGRRLWAAGPLPLGFAARGYSSIATNDVPRAQLIEPDGAPDVLVRHVSPFLTPGPAPASPGPLGQDRLARLSGRDGRVLWDIPLRTAADAPLHGQVPGGPASFGDLDGDGRLDAVLLLRPAPEDRSDGELKAIALKDGRPLWARPHDMRTDSSPIAVAVADLDGDRRAEVLVSLGGMSGGFSFQFQVVSELKALDGRDGRALWSWRARLAADDSAAMIGPLCLAGVDGGRRRVPCLVASHRYSSVRRLVVLDAAGHETARRDLPKSPYGCGLEAGDLDGDGNDELLFSSPEGLSVLGIDLKETWSRGPLVDPRGPRLLPASPGGGRPGVVMLSEAFGLDGRNGNPLWKGQSGFGDGHPGPRLLDRGDAARLPRFLGTGLGTTVGRSAMPVTPADNPAPPRGTPVPPGLARDDPRWTRPLPWVETVRLALSPPALYTAVGLALVNAVVPLGLLRLAARRRPWTLRLLMALPVAAALPLWTFPNVEPMLPSQLGAQPISARLMFACGTLAGLPIVALVWCVAIHLFRRRWKRLAWPAGLALAAAAIIAAVWLRIDLRTMPAIEHHGRSGWYLVLVPGAYAAGTLLLFAWIFRRPYRWLTRPRRPEVGTS